MPVPEGREETLSLGEGMRGIKELFTLFASPLGSPPASGGPASPLGGACCPRTGLGRSQAREEKRRYGRPQPWAHTAPHPVTPASPYCANLRVTGKQAGHTSYRAHVSGTQFEHLLHAQHCASTPFGSGPGRCDLVPDVSPSFPGPPFWPPRMISLKIAWLPTPGCVTLSKLLYLSGPALLCPLNEGKLAPTSQGC